MRMALRQFACGFTVMIVFSCRGCHLQSLSACGVAVNSNRIVGGTEAEPGSWPWQVILSSPRLFCAGTLINNQWVMTAAHCMAYPPDNYTITLGIHSRSAASPNKETRKISRAVCHPDYNSRTIDNDICLLKLSSPVNFTDYIQPVCLAAANSAFHHGTSSWVTGFGFTGSSTLSDTLQQAEVPIVENRICSCYYDELILITENMICAGLKQGGRSACKGDSGGPLITTKDSVWVQNGIVSFGYGCITAEKPGVYTLVPRYQKWITDNVDGTEPGFVTVTSSGGVSDSNFTCSTTTATPTSTPHRENVSSSGESLIHFAHVLSLCILVPSLHVLGGSGGL